LKEIDAHEYFEVVFRAVLQNTPKDTAVKMMETHRDGGAVVLFLTGGSRMVFHWDVGARPPMPEAEGSA
jgi:ATP-dependent Clp protease adapter protein ClpS